MFHASATFQTARRLAAEHHDPIMHLGRDLLTRRVEVEGNTSMSDTMPEEPTEPQPLAMTEKPYMEGELLVDSHMCACACCSISVSHAHKHTVDQLRTNTRLTNCVQCNRLSQVS